jgi:hypothetical protein
VGRGGTCIGHWWESQKELSQMARLRRRWVDNIRMDVGEIGWGGVDCIGQPLDVESSCGHCNEPSSSIKRWESIE